MIAAIPVASSVSITPKRSSSAANPHTTGTPSSSSRRCNVELWLRPPRSTPSARRDISAVTCASSVLGSPPVCATSTPKPSRRARRSMPWASWA